MLVFFFFQKSACMLKNKELLQKWIYVGVLPNSSRPFHCKRRSYSSGKSAKDYGCRSSFAHCSRMDEGKTTDEISISSVATLLL